MEDTLRRAVAARRSEVIERTRALIRVPTVNPPGDHYREICDLIAGWLAPMGFACAFIRAHGTPGDSDRHPRWNLVARREGSGPGPCVHFNGHTDVVEVGHGWTRDPFAGELVGDRVYGRGACDMKGGIAAAIVAVAAFLETHPDAPGSIEISATADEETGGTAASPTSPNKAATPRSITSSSPSRSTRSGYASVTGACGGPNSRRSGGSATARCRFSAIARCATWAR